MSDTRRRRKQSGGSDDLSESYDELNATKETQSSEQNDGRRDSEYDTAGTDSEGGSQDGGERESGDGQEEDKPRKKLDDDEDRRNPQYIPKRGTFYEHDDRTTEETAESTAEPPPERETKEKKVWKDKEDKWNHDRYNDDEQAPKSHEELIAVYGYDIRNEEGPPRARRRRRYGRGPNKYTRNWEDEDAYGKTAPTVTSGKNPGRKSNKNSEEFPALGGIDKDESIESSDEPVITSAWYSNKNKTPMKQQNFPPLQSQQDVNQKSKSGGSNVPQTNENRAPNEPTNPAWKKETRIQSRNISPNRNIVGGGANETEKIASSKPMTRDTKEIMKKRQVQESVSLAASRVRGRGFKANPNNNLVGNSRNVDLKPKGRGAGLTSIDGKRNNTTVLHDDEHQQHLNETKQMSPNDGSYHPRQSKNFYVQSPGQQRPSIVPQRMQQQPAHHHQQQQPPAQQLQIHEQSPQQIHPQQPDVAGNRPKRYSSLRQRSAIPEGPGQQQQPPYPPQHPQHGFYPPPAGNSHGVVESQGFPQGHFEPSTPVGSSPSPMSGQPVIPLAPGGQPAAYAPPAYMVPPPQFITPQAAPPSLINYVPTPAGPAFPPNFQAYQGYNPTVPPQGPPPPPELFQPQGCTYYSPAQQQQQQGAPMRRPKAAIPILPPPDVGSPYHHHHHHQQQQLQLQQQHHHHHHHQTSRGRGKTQLQYGNNVNASNVQPTMSQVHHHQSQRHQQQHQNPESDNFPREESTNEPTNNESEVPENSSYDDAVISVEDKKMIKLIDLPAESDASEVVVTPLTNVASELDIANEPIIDTPDIQNITDTATAISSVPIVEQPEIRSAKELPEAPIALDNAEEKTLFTGTSEKVTIVLNSEKETVVQDDEIKSIVPDPEKTFIIDTDSIVPDKNENSIVIDSDKNSAILDNGEIVLDKKEIVLDKEKIVLDVEKIALDEEKIVLDKEKIVLDKEKIVLDENEIVLDKEKIVLDENEIVLDKEKIVLDENEIVLDKEKIVLDEKEIVIDNKEIVIDNEKSSVLDNEKMLIVNDDIEKTVEIDNEKNTNNALDNEESVVAKNNESIASKTLEIEVEIEKSGVNVTENAVITEKSVVEEAVA